MLKETKSVDENQNFNLIVVNLIKVISKEENLIEITGNNIKQIIWQLAIDIYLVKLKKAEF